MAVSHITYNFIPSPIGEIVIGVSPAGCCLCEFRDRGGLENIRARVERRHGVEMVKGASPGLEEMEHRLGEYFEGRRNAFELPLDLKGTSFEVAVWHELLSIPYGETRSYGSIADQLGKPGAARAVGKANGSNFLAIIVPCHRVVQEDGALRGYGGGLWRKKFLLELERSHALAREESAIRQERLAFSV